ISPFFDPGACRVTSLSRSAEAGTEPATDSRPADPYHNPSYPQRIHFHEVARLDAVLHSCEERVSEAFQKLGAVANDAQKPRFVRIYHQLQGARDQIAEAVRRM